MTDLNKCFTDPTRTCGYPHIKKTFIISYMADGRCQRDELRTSYIKDFETNPQAVLKGIVDAYKTLGHEVDFVRAIETTEIALL